MRTKSIMLYKTVQKTTVSKLFKYFHTYKKSKKKEKELDNQAKLWLECLVNFLSFHSSLRFEVKLKIWPVKTSNILSNVLPGFNVLKNLLPGFPTFFLAVSGVHTKNFTSFTVTSGVMQNHNNLVRMIIQDNNQSGGKN